MAADEAAIHPHGSHDVYAGFGEDKKDSDNEKKKAINMLMKLSRQQHVDSLEVQQRRNETSVKYQKAINGESFNSNLRNLPSFRVHDAALCAEKYQQQQQWKIQGDDAIDADQICLNK